MAEISWTDEAQRWLNDIFEYIAADNPQAATRTVEGIYDRAQDLRRFPELGSRYAASSRNVLRASFSAAKPPIEESTKSHSMKRSASSTTLSQPPFRTLTLRARRSA